MTQTIPVNPEVLKWVRKTAGLSIEDVVLKLKRKTIDKNIIARWEEGEGSPSYSQLEALAYDIYKRPLAIFFFPNPPQEEMPEQNFRTLPEYEIDSLPSRIRFLIRKAKVMQINLDELYDEKNPGSRQIVKDLSFNPKVSPAVMAKTVRDYLGIKLETQTSWIDEEQAFKKWREVFVENGIFVFKDAFKVSEFSGFCLYNTTFPTIYINNSKAKTRQIFTLFHELAHLLFKTGGVDTRIENYSQLLKGDNKLIEFICNSFAGEFLVPSKEFWKEAGTLPVDETTFENLAQKYCVSREVILRKFRDKEKVTQPYYNKMTKEWNVPSKKGGGGTHYGTKMAYLGERYLSQAFGKYFQKQISRPQLADYLGENEKNIPGFEERILKFRNA